MTNQAYLISRRHLLRGMGTVAIGLPLLEIMSPAIATASARAKTDSKVQEEVTQPKEIACGKHATKVLRLGAGERHRRLAFGAPGNGPPRNQEHPSRG